MLLQPARAITNMPHALDKITQVGANGKDAYTYYPVVVIGAGESGICMGARLQQTLSFDQFRIFERKSQLGGTWYTNTYPGIACDVPAIMYSFSWHQNPKWTAPYPPGPEIVRYLYSVCNRFKLLDKIQCNTNVKSMRWIELDEEWEIILEHLAPGVGDMATMERRAFEKEKGADASILRTERIRAKIVASACGGLVEPKPNIEVPGLDTFEGKVIHTARWDPTIDLKDKHITVIGTGCSSAQVVASVVKPEFGIKSVTQILRSPPWVVPALEADEKATKVMTLLCTYIPGFQNTVRKIGFAVSEWDFLSHFPDTNQARNGRKATAKVLLAHMRKLVPKEYQEILTPNYEVFCKRRVIDDGWFKSLQDPRAEITSQPITAVGSKTVTLGPGRYYPPMEDKDSKAPTDKREIPCDVIVMANGFETNEWLHPLDVIGKGGKSLYEVWKERGGAQAYLGTAMDGFPQFHILLGPNTVTGHSSVILASENLVNYSLNFIAPLLKGEIRTYDVKESAERKWTKDLQDELKGSVFQSGGCRSWYYKANDGWNSTVYPRTQIDFSLRCMFPRFSHWNITYTKKGLLLLWMRRLFKTAIFLTTLLGASYIYRFGREAMAQQARELISLVRDTISDGLRYAGVTT